VSQLIFQIISLLERHRFLSGVVLVFILLAAGAGLFSLTWNNSLELMLPEDSDVTEMVYFLGNSQISGKVLLSFTRDPSTCSLSRLLEVTDEFSSQLDSNLISKVVKGFAETQVIEDVFFFMQRAPELLGPKDYETLFEITSEAGIEKALRSKYLELMRPQGSFFSKMFQQDPLDIQTILQSKIQRLSNSFGYDIQLIQGRLVSSDQLHALMILDTPVSFSDSVQSKILIESLEAKIKSLPQGVTADFMSSHTHTVSNQAVIQRDIQVTLSIAGFAFLILFVLYFRDYRAGLIFVLPLGAVLLAGNCAAWVIGSMSPMVMGLGSVIVGIAVDYGIHIYTAIRQTQDAHRAIKEVTRPLLVGALTTLCVFMAFLACSIPAYQHLAWFAFFGLTFALVGAVILLPVHILPKPLVVAVKSSSALSRKQATGRAVVFLILVLIGIWGSLSASFESDITQLDGTARIYTDQEKNIQRDWGRGRDGQALAVVQGESLEQALERNDSLYTALRQDVDEEALASFSVVWKSAKERQKNADQWNLFWSDERIGQVKALMVEKSEPFDFALDAFDPFWQDIRYSFSGSSLPTENTIFNQFQERFVQHRDGVFSLVTLLSDSEENLAILNGLKDDVPDLMIIAKQSFSERMTALYSQEIVRVVLVAFVLVIVSCLAILRNIRMTVFSLVPVVAALISILAIMSWMGYPLNVANLMACIVVIGLCIDYGVFVVYAQSEQLDVGTTTAVTLSAGTTFVGAGSLLFAQHPTLFFVGSTVVIGITAGYLACMLVVPALCTLFPLERPAV